MKQEKLHQPKRSGMKNTYGGGGGGSAQEWLQPGSVSPGSVAATSCLSARLFQNQQKKGHVRTQWEEDSPQAGKRGRTRNQPCWHRDLGLSGLQDYFLFLLEALQGYTVWQNAWDKNIYSKLLPRQSLWIPEELQLHPQDTGLQPPGHHQTPPLKTQNGDHWTICPVHSLTTT